MAEKRKGREVPVWIRCDEGFVIDTWKKRWKCPWCNGVFDIPTIVDTPTWDYCPKCGRFNNGGKRK